MSQESPPQAPVFTRASVPLQIVLNLLTSALFGYWCLYQQTQVVNAHRSSDAVPSWLVGAGIASFVMFLLIYISYLANLPEPPTNTLVIAQLVAISSMVGWSLRVRRGINALSNAKMGDPHWVSLPLTLLAALFNFMSPMYFQFVINRVLTARGRD